MCVCVWVGGTGMQTKDMKWHWELVPKCSHSYFQAAQKPWKGVEVREINELTSGLVSRSLLYVGNIASCQKGNWIKTCCDGTFYWIEGTDSWQIHNHRCAVIASSSCALEWQRCMFNILYVENTLEHWSMVTALLIIPCRASKKKGK